ncbi:ROK family protein [Oceanispirochaeta crateris]|uniref:ROK family protein n=1 Tax=Oceanispirochaeta crateris TaxID=2518645 RepID=A0A5C1QEK4_9SPIO|nr:ROK family protein [Oceanispirochaeta crateris]QEN06465.1 ROK family protein [Oceanispirochaeta crateris]
MIENQIVGVDIGGTKIAVLRGTPEGQILEKIKFQTLPGWEQNLEKIADLILEFKRKEQGQSFLAIGISCGGPLNDKTGVIHSPPNLPGWDDVPVCRILEETTGIQAYLENDANACALAEWKWGAGRGYENLVFLTFGTGLGAGLILNNRLYSGTSGQAGEVGHIRLTTDGPLGYGKNGSWEGYCSGGGMSNHYRDVYHEDLSAKEICLRANQKDQKALNIIKSSSQQLGRGLAILLDVLNPELIIIGSIFSRDENLFRSQLEKILAEESLPQTYADCKVVVSELGESLGDLAALGVAMKGVHLKTKQEELK